MQLSDTIETSFEEFVNELPKDYQQQAYEFKAFARGRKIETVEQLFMVVMLYCGLDYSLRSCAGIVAGAQGAISDTAIEKRLKACVPWVKSLLRHVFGLDEVVNSGHLRFIVIDGSTIQEPGAKETTYRLHVAIDLISLTLQQVKVTTDKEGEHLFQYELEPGDVVLADRGYNQPKTLVPFIDAGKDIVLRYNPHSMNLYTTSDDDENQMVKVDWAENLRSLDNQPGHFPCYLLHDGKRIEVTVHAFPLPQEKAAEARRKAKKRAKKAGREIRQNTLYISGWVLVLTSLPLKRLDTKTAAALYRVRWQIELVIKRLKSLLDVDKLRAFKNSPLAELYLHGKLLYATILEKISNKRFACAATSMDKPRKITNWRLWQLIRDEVQASFKRYFPFRKRFLNDAVRSLAERPRKRRLQSLPEPITELIQFCKMCGLSDC